jgi:hypothetical protein
MLQPRSALRHNVDVHSTERIEKPMSPLAQQPNELAAPKQQPNLEAANKNLLEEHKNLPGVLRLDAALHSKRQSGRKRSNRAVVTTDFQINRDQTAFPRKRTLTAIDDQPFARSFPRSNGGLRQAAALQVEIKHPQAANRSVVTDDLGGRPLDGA